MRVLQVYEIIYMNIVRCGLLGLPGELQHTRASFPHLALQGANKFFTLAMRPVQPLTWDCAGHGHGWLTRCTQKLVKPSQTFCILQQKSVQKEHSSSLRRIIYNHCKHWKVRQTPAVRMRCIPMPVILRNHERTCEQRTGRKGYNYCATPRQTCWLNVAIRWIKDSGPETHQIQVSVKKGVHAKIRCDMMQFHFANDKYKGSRMPALPSYPNAWSWGEKVPSYLSRVLSNPHEIFGKAMTLAWFMETSRTNIPCQLICKSNCLTH